MVGYDFLGKSIMGEDVSCVYFSNSSGVNLLVARYEDGGFGAIMIGDG